MAKTCYRQANGNWDDTNWWDSPTSGLGNKVTIADGDTVNLNGKTVALNVASTPSIASLVTGGATTAGMITVALADGSKAITCASISSSSMLGNAISISGTAPNNTLTYNGNITGGSNSFTYVSFSSTGTLLINGSLTGGGGGHAVRTSSTGTVHVTGNCTGGSTGGSALVVTGASTVTIDGDAKGGAGGGTGVSHSGAGATINVLGNVLGGTFSGAVGLYSTALCTINISGNVQGGSVDGAYAMSSSGVNSVINVGDSVIGGAYAANGLSVNAAATVTITNNIINSAYSFGYSGPTPVWNGGDNKYIQWGDAVKYVKQEAAADLRAGTAHGNVTGTLNPHRAINNSIIKGL